jgi:PAS domain S-box-containing protein
VSIAEGMAGTGLTAIAAQNQDREILEGLPVALYLTDAQGRLTFYNRAAAEFWGRRPDLSCEYWCGSWRLYWSDGRAMKHEECPLAVTLRTGVPLLGAEAIQERPDGRRVFFRPHPALLYDAAGRITGALNVLVDIGSHKEAELHDRHFAAIVEFSDDAIISKNLDGIILSWNAGARRVFGYTDEEAIGRPVLMLIPEDRHDEEPDILRRIRSGERIDHYETMRRRKDGSLVDISLTVSPIKNEKGEIIGASKIARDISERRKAEKAKELLLHEIKHRVKNTLGTVQAIAFQTFHQAPHSERNAFNARLRALAGAHDLLTSHEGDCISSVMMVERALAPFREERAERITMEGPDVHLGSDKALLLTMVLHELATNAVKYGALSDAAGRVSLSWREEAEPGRLAFDWRESGGPTVKPPTSRGFGSTLIERALQQEHGRAQLQFAPSGLICRLEMEI